MQCSVLTNNKFDHFYYDLVSITKLSRSQMFDQSTEQEIIVQWNVWKIMRIMKMLPFQSCHCFVFDYCFEMIITDLKWYWIYSHICNAWFLKNQIFLLFSISSCHYFVFDYCFEMVITDLKWHWIYNRICNAWSFRNQIFLLFSISSCFLCGESWTCSSCSALAVAWMTW